MNRLFDMENPFWQGLSIVADMMMLNLLTLLCSLPLVTLGAAFTAMNDVVIRIVRKEEGGIVRGFGKAFRQNLKNGCLFGLLLLAVMGILYFDYLCALTYAPVFRFGIAALAILLLAVAIYTFALLARYENGLFATIKNAAALCVAFFPRTLGILVFTLALWLLGVRFYRIGAPVLILLGFSLPCYVAILLLRPMFNRLEQPVEESEKND